ncbi:unnamed protein product [Arctogadus glacialis]
MEPEEVKKKIKTGELKVSKFEGKSEVWTYFKQVVGSDNVCVGFVECSVCVCVCVCVCVTHTHARSLSLSLSLSRGFIEIDAKKVGV